MEINYFSRPSLCHCMPGVTRMHTAFYDFIIPFISDIADAEI